MYPSFVCNCVSCVVKVGVVAGEGIVVAVGFGGEVGICSTLGCKLAFCVCVDVMVVA